MDGYLILQRQVMELLEQHDGNVIKVYLACQRRAAFKDQEIVTHSGKTIKISKGSLMISTRGFAKNLRMTHKQIRYALTVLSNLEIVRITTAPKWTILTVFGYGSTMLKGAQSGHNVGHNLGTMITDDVLKDLSEKGHSQNSKQGTVRSKEVKKELKKTSTEQIISDLPENRGAKAMDKQPDPKEMAWVKDVLLKDLPLYLADENLMAVDRHTGQIRIMELVRQWRIAHPSANAIEVLRQAHAKEFCSTHKKRAGRAAWLNEWMKREHSRGGIWKNGAITKDKKPTYQRLEETIGTGMKEILNVTQTIAASVTEAITPAPPRRPIKPPVEDWTPEEANFTARFKANLAAQRQTTLGTPAPDRTKRRETSPGGV